jgi:hypothetical protein
MKLNIVDGKFFMEVLNPQDVLVDRYVNPWDIESARYEAIFIQTEYLGTVASPD